VAPGRRVSSSRTGPAREPCRGAFVGRYIADLIVESRVVVEVEAARAIDPAHRAQLVNYLRATRLQVGLLLDFGRAAQFKRAVSDANGAWRSG
jgi:GxxExxY protein